MLVGFLSTLFFIFNTLLIILIVMQKNHGGFWSGPAGNDSVNVFGGNQGVDVLQKLTWAFGMVLIFGCLFLAVYQSSQSEVSQFYSKEIKEEILKTEEKNKVDLADSNNDGNGLDNNNLSEVNNNNLEEMNTKDLVKKS
jgi:protein translocase SecG subunit